MINLALHTNIVRLFIGACLTFFLTLFTTTEIARAGYDDIESSTSNVFSAVTLDFSAEKDSDFTGLLLPSSALESTIAITNHGTVDIPYAAKVVNPVGTLCDDLIIEIDIESTSETGALLGYQSLPYVLSDDSIWAITVSLDGAPISAIAQTCSFDMEFEGSLVTGGFIDQESVSYIVTAGSWSTTESCEDTPAVVIDSILTGSQFDFTGSHVYIVSGGGLEASGASLQVTTNCNLIVEDGGEIAASSGPFGGFITLNIGGDIDINGNSVRADGGSGPGLQAGGWVQISAGGYLKINGTVSASGEDLGGQITLSSGGLTMITSGGRVDASAGAADGFQYGGFITMSSGGMLSVAGTIDISAEDVAGVLTISAPAGAELQSGSTIFASSSPISTGEGLGGQVSIVTLGNVLLQGFVDLSSLNGGAGLAVTTPGSINASGAFTATNENAAIAPQPSRIQLASLATTSLNASSFSLNGAVEGQLIFSSCNLSGSPDSYDVTPLYINNCDGVILNEIMPNPVGLDDDSQPNGEWVELYNFSQTPVDIDGWVLYDDIDSHELIINNSKTATGSTVIPARGFLVVFRDGDSDFSLNNDFDRVRLFDDTLTNGGLLRDSYSYSNTKSEGLTHSRIPDGGVWIDPPATPGLPNALTFEDWRSLFGLDPIIITEADTENIEGEAFAQVEVQELVEDNIEEIESINDITVSAVENAIDEEGQAVEEDVAVSDDTGPANKVSPDSSDSIESEDLGETEELMDEYVDEGEGASEEVSNEQQVNFDEDVEDDINDAVDLITEETNVANEEDIVVVVGIEEDVVNEAQSGNYEDVDQNQSLEIVSVDTSLELHDELLENESEEGYVDNEIE